MRLSQVAKVLNVGIATVVSHLSAKGFKVESNPNTKLYSEQLEVLAKDFKSTDLVNGAGARRPDSPAPAAEAPRRDEGNVVQYFRDDQGRPTSSKPQPTPEPAPAERGHATPVQDVRKAEERAAEPASGNQLPGLKVLGKIDLSAKPAPAQPKPAAPAPVEAKQPQPAPAQPAPRPAAEPAQPVVARQPETPEPQRTDAPKPAQPAAPAPAPVEAKQPEPAPTQPQPQAAPRPAAEPAQPVVAKQPETPEPQRTEAPKPAQPAAPAPAPVEASQPKPAPAQPQAAPRPAAEPAQPIEAKQSQPVEQHAERPAQPVEQNGPSAPVAPPVPADETEADGPSETIRAEGRHQLRGLTIKGKIDLPVDNPRQSGGGDRDRDKKKKRKRIRSREGVAVGPNTGGGGQPGQPGGQGGNNFRNREGGPDRGPAERGPAQRGPGDRNPNDRSPQGDRNQQGRGPGDRAPQGDRPQTPRPPGDRGPAQPGNRPPNAGGAPGTGNNANRGGNNNANKRPDRPGDKKRERREEPSARDVRDSIKATQSRMLGSNKPNRGAKAREDRRRNRAEREEQRLLAEQEDAKVLKVTEFVSANDLASLMDVSVNEVISVCMSLGMFVSINQRLDAEAITVIADEFGYDVQFVSAEEEVEAGIDDGQNDAEEDLEPRAPIVTIMGHVDHGKTSLLDYIRRTRVAAGEAGGITQHIGAYGVTTEDGRMITFLDTPGHEAFTAMRARGAKVTDVVIIVIAADDSVMPQTREAINHAQVAGVPIVFAFSKVDKPGANAEKIREELAQMNLLVEDWGGKYQAQEISSKSGMGIDDLLEKVLLEAELLDLKSNPNRRANGTVIEASLDKGRGYVSTILVQNGTLKVGDIVLVGAHYGRIRAMTDDVGQRIKEAGPSTPVQILGLPGAPQAGDKFNVMETEREAREIANKREQLVREQTMRTRKHITLEEIGRRKAIGSFKELNVIVKGDVDGSVEALSDSLLQLSTEEVQVNIIHKAVGQISESDILLASASDAIIVGFQVRPSASARRLAEQEQIEIRLYSIIYDAINEVKDAMEGMLAPTVEEVIVGNIEVREVFKISKIGTVAGCYVTDGLIKRNNKIRVIRDFIVVHTGEISALKRFKDDVNEVRSGYECGLSIKNFNDILEGDTIESFELKEVKRTL
ncbi:translation initiation factor IF-2 [Nibrella saemangeumensis]|uniref:Translation initiation factor IF-2 n=1 Tax=Nibrella saemangeumensis TaxID=1084526 RepID=A0ABP8MFJ9_9BACT